MGIINRNTQDGDMKIHLDLSRHCIETALKQLYEQSVSACLKGSSGRDDTQTIELTKYALEQLDFNHLRSRFRPLAGGTDYAVMLSISEKRLIIWVDDRIIETCSLCTAPEQGK